MMSTRQPGVLVVRFTGPAGLLWPDDDIRAAVTAHLERGQGVMARWFSGPLHPAYEILDLDGTQSVAPIPLGKNAGEGAPLSAVEELVGLADYYLNNRTLVLAFAEADVHPSLVAALASAACDFTPGAVLAVKGAATTVIPITFFHGEPGNVQGLPPCRLTAVPVEMKLKVRGELLIFDYEAANISGVKLLGWAARFDVIHLVSIPREVLEAPAEIAVQQLQFLFVSRQREGSTLAVAVRKGVSTRIAAFIGAAAAYITPHFLKNADFVIVD